MSNYRVITGPAVTQSGMICGASASASGSPFEVIINEQAKEGYELVQVFGHQVKGAICCIIPSNLTVNLLVFVKKN